MKRKSWIAAIVLACPVAGGIARAQGAATQTAPPPPPPAMQPAMRVISPEVSPDHRIVFRILAPQAKTVGLRASDIQGLPREGPAFSKDDDGVWSATVGPIDPGAYRYTFMVDGVPTMDPRNPAVSESNTNDWSLVYVPGADFMDTANVPHGAVASVTYYSTALSRFRRMHVYTPPGYEMGGGKFPIFYLLHGAFDSDDSWSSVGRAGFILDNLIAAGKAKPMVVVMPHGHTGPFSFGMPLSGGFEPEFVADIMPQMEKRYRVYTDRQHRAMAGLSMGGAHTLNIGIPHLDKFAYLGVFSSGIFGITGGPGGNPPQGPAFEESNKAILDDAKLKDGLKLFWFATGKDDFLVATSRATVEMFKKHQFEVTFKESGGAHTWDNWREYLREFAPQLFQ